MLKFFLEIAKQNFEGAMTEASRRALEALRFLPEAPRAGRNVHRPIPLSPLGLVVNRNPLSVPRTVDLRAGPTL